VPLIDILKEAVLRTGCLMLGVGGAGGVAGAGDAGGDAGDGRLKLNVDRLGALGEPKSLRWLRSTTGGR